jgi:hypothetical protein
VPVFKVSHNDNVIEALNVDEFKRGLKFLMHAKKDVAWHSVMANGIP